MSDNCNYDKTKLLHELGKISWHIEKHAKPDAEAAGHPLCGQMYDEIKQDVDRSIGKLKAAVTGLSREGKF